LKIQPDFDWKRNGRESNDPKKEARLGWSTASILKLKQSNTE